MKKTVLLQVLCCMAGFAMAQDGLKDRINIPFYDFKKVEEACLLKKHGIYDTIWVPISATGKYPDETEFHLFYDYYADGWIKSWSCITPIEKSVRSYVKHYPVPLIPTYQNMAADTTVFYKKESEEGDYSPTMRYFYDYSVYPDALSYYRQNWVEGRWETEYKEEIYYQDTLTVSRYAYLEETFDKEGVQTGGLWYIPVFDDNGNVVEEYTKQYKKELGEYVDVWKIELFYEGSVLKETINYQYYNGEYFPFNKHTDLEWHEYYGFGNGTFFEWNTSDRRNKCASRRVWLADNRDGAQEEWIFYLFVKTHWKTDGSLCVDDTLYYYSTNLDTLTASIISNNYHDDHDNLKYSKNTTYYNPEYHGFNDTTSYGLDSLINHYDTRGQLYRYDQHTERYINFPGEDPDNTDGIEYSYAYCEVDSFRYYLPSSIDEELPYLSQVLQILPNPSVDGGVRIIAASNMLRISLYSLNGKILHDATASGKETTISTTQLPQGIYIVQALLKNGEIQTGKLVVK